MKNHGSSLTSVVLAVAAAVGVGVGGYYIMGGCSSCEAGAEANATAVGTDTELDACCAAEGAVETVALEAEDECCSAAAEGEAQTVAMEGKVCTMGVECPEGMEDCESKADCEAKAGADQTECEKACEEAAKELTKAETETTGNG